jgi:predicted Zn-dependent protease with MMP-like domain
MRRRLQLSRGRIRRYVQRALDALPAEFRAVADNVHITVENSPRRGDYASRRDGEDAGAPLVGMYRGVPLGERAGYNVLAPDVIAIFRKPLLRIVGTRRQAEAEVRLTVLHEFGHFLGLSEEQVEHL